MNKLLFGGIIWTCTCLFIGACKERPTYQLTYCTQVNTDSLCTSSQTEFKLGERIYLVLKSEESLPKGKIVGLLYTQAQGSWHAMGKRDWEVTDETYRITDYLEITRPGVYEVQVSEGSGKILLTESFTIK